MQIHLVQEVGEKQLAQWTARLGAADREEVLAYIAALERNQRELVGLLNQTAGMATQMVTEMVATLAGSFSEEEWKKFHEGQKSP